MRSNSGAGQPLGQRLGIGVDDLMHERDEHLPRVTVAGHSGFHGVDVALQAGRRQRLEQYLFALVPVIQGAYAHSGMLRDGGDGGAGVVDEHRAGGREDLVIVAGRFRGTALHRRRGLGH